MYTALQFVFCVGIYLITKTAAGIAFPALIAALVAARWLVLPRLFSHEAIVAMDGDPGSDDDDNHEDIPEPRETKPLVKTKLTQANVAFKRDMDKVRFENTTLMNADITEQRLNALKGVTVMR